MNALREMWWPLTGRRMPGAKPDPRLSWFHEQANAARRSAVEAEQEMLAERTRRQNIVEQAYLRGRGRD